MKHVKKVSVAKASLLDDILSMLDRGGSEGEGEGEGEKK